MSEQTYVKNTDVPHPDSFLWTLGDGWKVSQKTGDIYSSIDRITDEALGTALTTISESGNIDIIEYDDGNYFFVPNKFVDNKTGKATWSVFAFENRIKANKKLEDVRKFANFKPKVATGPVLKPSGQQTISKPVTVSTTAPVKSTMKAEYGAMNTFEDASQSLTFKQRWVISFTDPTPVTYDNKEQIATLLTDGYSFLPRSLVEKNFWEQPEYNQETGEVIGTKLIFLMGRIINVEIPENN